MKLNINQPIQKSLQTFIDEDLVQYRMMVIKYLLVVGEKCINDARLKGSYTDRTGNLRSSIGYVIVDDGQIVQLSMNPKTLNGEEGLKEGESYLQRLAREHSTGLVLIVVAGMNYAMYVADRGYNVLDSADMLAEKLVREIQMKLGQ